jgi:GWxTD domain-containing protein
MKNKTGHRTTFLYAAIVLIAALNSCAPAKQPVDSKDLSYLYNPTKNSVNPRYNVLNQSDNTSILSVKFFANDLFFSEANPQGVPTSQMLISAKLFNISQGKVLADTAVYNLSIIREKGKTEYTYNIPLKVEKGFEYIAELKILDRLKLHVIQSFVPFNTLSYTNKYNFIAVGHFEKNQLFNPVIRVNEYVNLLYSREKPDSLIISYYKPFREIPDPPSMLLPEKTLDYGPEKVIGIHYSDTMPMMFPKEGIYMCSVSRKAQDGFSFYNFGATFPNLTSPEVMIEPLAYLATRDEMEEMRTALKPKAVLDDYWIKCGGNIDKARELIKIYYNRVLYSNYYFTSYKEGWRSERGMIYIIYGPPDKVYKTSEGESWGYRKPVVKSSWGGRYSVQEDYLFFNFRKKASVFSDNDYYLSRSETLVTYWDKAVESWKKGVVFRLDNPEVY